MPTLTSSDIREQLKYLGYTDDMLLGRSKKELLTLLEGENGQEFEVDADLDNPEEIEQNFGDDKKVEEFHPPMHQIPYTDPNWNDFVLSQFTKDEMVDDCPKLDGLRRVVELLLGPVIESATSVIQFPTPENGYRASATVTVTIDGLSGIRLYSGSADACKKNTASPFDEYPVAMAENRAEARALRRALRLRNVSAEELPNKTELSKNEVALINENQLNLINMMTGSNRLNINVQKFLQYHFDKGELSTNNVSNLTELDGTIIARLLNEAQKDVTKIPVELTGYDTNWR